MDLFLNFSNFLGFYVSKSRNTGVACSDVLDFLADSYEGIRCNVSVDSIQEVSVDSIQEVIDVLESGAVLKDEWQGMIENLYNYLLSVQSEGV